MFRITEFSCTLIVVLNFSMTTVDSKLYYLPEIIGNVILYVTPPHIFRVLPHPSIYPSLSILMFKCTVGIDKPRRCFVTVKEDVNLT